MDVSTCTRSPTMAVAFKVVGQSPPNLAVPQERGSMNIPAGRRAASEHHCWGRTKLQPRRCDTKEFTGRMEILCQKKLELEAAFLLSPRNPSAR